MPENFDLNAGEEKIDHEAVEQSLKLSLARRAVRDIKDLHEMEDSIIEPELFEQLAGEKIRELKENFQESVEALGDGLKVTVSAQEKLEFIEALESFGFIDPARVKDILGRLMIYPETLRKIRAEAEQEIKRSNRLSEKLKRWFAKRRR